MTRQIFDTQYAKAPNAVFPHLTEPDDKANALLQCLYKAVSLKRGGGTMTEAKFVAWLVHRLPVTAIDEHGNIHIDTRTGPEHRTLLTAHTDTVHHTGGTNQVVIDTTTEPGQTFWRAHGDALGADDGAGIALIYEMIVRGFKGYAILFRLEETGGVGSQGLAASQPDLLKLFDRAIAFDRANYYDVITHQSGGRCASDEFAQALADQINCAGDDFMYCPDAGGVYTDTAEFTHLIPECTNLSVGYFSQHGDREHQNVTFLAKLAEALCLVKWDDLPVVRRAAKETYSRYAKATAADDKRDWNDWFKRYDADMAEADDDAEYDESCTAARVTLLLEAAMDGQLLGLVDAMCETVAPIYAMDADEAMHYVRTNKLTPLVLEGCYDQIMAGDEPDLVLTDLYDYCTS